MMIGDVFADVVSRDPNYIKNRGYGFDKVHIANYQKKELSKHNYSIIKDPTGRFKLIENFSPRKGDCGTGGHFWKSNKVKVGSGTTDCNSNRLRLEVAMEKEIYTGKKDKNVWLSYYLYIPDTPDNLTDPFYFSLDVLDLSLTPSLFLVLCALSLFLLGLSVIHYIWAGP